MRQGHLNGWLIGQASQDGVLQAFEGWLYDEHGRIYERKQFIDGGVYVSMRTIEVQGGVMISEGSARDLSGAEVLYRHTVEKASDALLRVQWEKNSGVRGDYKSVVKEQCRKAS